MGKIFWRWEGWQQGWWNGWVPCVPGKPHSWRQISRCRWKGLATSSPLKGVQLFAGGLHDHLQRSNGQWWPGCDGLPLVCVMISTFHLMDLTFFHFCILSYCNMWLSYYKICLSLIYLLTRSMISPMLTQSSLISMLCMAMPSFLLFHSDASHITHVHAFIMHCLLHFNYPQPRA